MPRHLTTSFPGIHVTGADATGVSDSTAAIQAALDAHPRQTLILPPGVYKYSRLTITKGQTLRGASRSTSRDRYSTRGSAGWSVDANFGGTVLRSTAADGTTITILDTEVNEGGLVDLTIIGPGTGTAIGVEAGSLTMSIVNLQMRNVMIGNFYIGMRTQNLNEAVFDGVIIRGCDLGLHLSEATNQNEFRLLDIQLCTNAMVISATSYANAFYSPICQSNIGVAVEIRGSKNAFYNPYFENNAMAIDLVPGAMGNKIDAPFLNSTDDSIRVQADANDNILTGVGWNGGAATVTNAGSRTVIQGRIPNLTDTGYGTVLVDTAVAGSPFSNWAAYTPALSGGGWSLGNGTATGSFTTIGRTVHFQGRIQFGTTTVAGSASPAISAPFTALKQGTVQALFVDEGNTFYGATARFLTNTATFNVFGIGASGAVTEITATSPFTFVPGDAIEFSGTYERP